jgi:hypothetical protein
VEVIRKTLFESETLQIGPFEAHPVSDACGDVERQSLNVVVLPFSGVFSKHDGPGRQVAGTPSHAVFIASDTPYRIGFPDGIGDRALTLRFGEAPGHLDTRGSRKAVASHGLLPASAMMLRNLLWARLERSEVDEFEIETFGLDLLNMSLNSMRPGNSTHRRSTLTRWARALERVKEAVALALADKWDVAKLAKVANLSPFCAASFAKWPARQSTIMFCKSASPTRWTRFSAAAPILPPSRSMQDLRAIATSRQVSGISSVVPQLRCGVLRQPKTSPNCARS